MRIKKIPVTAFLIPFLILLFSFRLVVFDAGFYKSEFEKYGIYEKFDRGTADSVAENLISYMKSGEPLSDFFNEKEKLHMTDVRSLVRMLLIAMYVLLGIIVSPFIRSKKYFLRSLLYGGGIALFVILLFSIFSFTNFDAIFHKFHELSFSNDFWMLDPEVDNLKALMPDGFFYDALFRIFFISAITSVGFGLIGYFSLRRFKYT